ncbi:MULTISPECIES: PKD domain-containing protein [unclassified Pseudoalteromonas]|uniref:PKD domain-containing protein n=1 Tax=unclassified Pseudoalteromonas TaxID=194690 RepID=UPI0016042FF3|nr:MULTISPECIES: Ig-like domain-containing protein [unclassified Pseudoalteromonas]MBB1332340.1 PKD domain protein [Pseudoalteromonas sp. SR41-6]MBB1416019.1 PKD domain protein [Pseudoalteromonas sp. SG44-1]MBB1457598.1 PKD domain protein [Pseudoalteromonas sp. SG41-8]MBB1468253.1 PKD domain protein [Pseudoalteromonas sp. SG41-5]
MKWSFLIQLALILTLTACGSGGGDSEKKPTNKVTNNKPVAMISAPTGEMRVNTALTFSGTKSSDPDGDSLVYKWRLTTADGQNEIALAVDNENKVEVSLAEAKSYKLILVVSDGKLSSAPVEKLIEIKADPTQLIAHAGLTQTVKQGDVVALNGALSSTSNGVINKYLWQFTAKPLTSNAIIENNNSVTSKFIADKTGAYAIKLTITNSLGETASNEVMIKSESLYENSAPQAVIKVQNKTVAPRSIVTLDGKQSSDPDQGDTLSYLWTITAQPADSNPTLTDNLSNTAGFSSLDLGEYTLSLTVKDQYGETDTATVTLTVEIANQAPIAQLVAERNINLAETITLQCEQCNDPEGQPLSYLWQIKSRPENSKAQLIQGTTATPSISADIEGDYVITLIVSDGQLNSEQVISVLHAQANAKPTAIIADVAPILVDEEIQLDGSQSTDPEGKELTYQWEILSPLGRATLSNTDVAKPYFKASGAGSFVISLRTNDGNKDSDTQTITIIVRDNAKPVIISKGEQLRQAFVGNIVTFDVSQSYDPEETNLNYTWGLTKPNESNAALVNIKDGVAEFTPDIIGSYNVTVTVTDAEGNAAVMEFAISATDSALLTGIVKGQITNVAKVGINNAILMINGKQHTTNSSGFFEAIVSVEQGATVSISTADERLATSEYSSAAITQNDFIININQTSLPVFQDVEVSVFVCPDFTGPDTVNLRFKMIDTILTSNSFQAQYDETKPLILQKSNNTYLDSTLNIALPVTATYEITVVEDNVRNTSYSSTAIYYSQSPPNLAIITICNN